MFEIGNVDLTDYIARKTYKVNESDVTSTWTDIRFKKHVNVIRKKVSGTFTANILNEIDFAQFVSAVASKVVTASVFINNLNTTKTIEAYVSYTTEVVFKNSANNEDPGIFRVSIKLEEL